MPHPAAKAWPAPDLAYWLLTHGPFWLGVAVGALLGAGTVLLLTN